MSECKIRTGQYELSLQRISGNHVFIWIGKVQLEEFEFLAGKQLLVEKDLTEMKQENLDMKKHKWDNYVTWEYSIKKKLKVKLFVLACHWLSFVWCGLSLEGLKFILNCCSKTCFLRQIKETIWFTVWKTKTKLKRFAYKTLS